MVTSSEDRFDILVRTAQLYDGSGGAPSKCDVGIRGDRVNAVGDLAHAEGDVEIDATGLAVAPGFIDTHTHDDLGLLTDPDMSCKMSQGVTTVVVGNCGFSLAPTFGRRPPPLLRMDAVDDPGQYRFETFAGFMDTLEARPAAANAVCLVGHGSLRSSLMPELDRPATKDEISIMRGHVREAMEAGAAGLSTGLFYPGSRAAPTDEVVALAEEVKPFGGLYATHIRDESAQLVESVDEALEIGARAGIGVILSHHKASGKAHQGKTKESLARVAEASKTQFVGLDAYPYIASSTMLLPIRTMQATKILITWSEPIPDASGRDLAELAEEHGVSIEEMSDRLRPAGAIYFTMADEDVERVLSYPDTMIGSDGLFHDVHPHPRLWGTFPRVLGHYARETGLMPMEEAVRRMTSLPAGKFGLQDRGAIREGAFADLVVFDPATVIDRATFEEPTLAAGGIHTVFTNGKPVWQSGSPTGETPGRVLK